MAPMRRLKKAALRRIARLYGLDLIVLFGSQAKGRARPGSDMDVAILPGGRPRPFDAATWNSLTEDLAQTLQAPDGVDMIDLRGASPLLQYEVARSGVLLHARRTEQFSRFRLYASRRFDDNRKFFEAQARYLRRRSG
jgi:predicted nucleotidyltransferase